MPSTGHFFWAYQNPSQNTSHLDLLVPHCGRRHLCPAHATLAMGRKAKVQPEPAAAAQLRAVEIELLPGEKDIANFGDIEKLANAWACIQEHDLFHSIQGAKLAGITANATESGAQSPSDLQSYRAALKTAGQSYTAGINFFLD